jgi:hypothetical protein
LAILYVDDTDILHINLTKDESTNNVHTVIQDSVNSWGNLLIAMGGVLQPNKCFYSIISFKWIDGEWKYTNNSDQDNLGITVPLPSGLNEPISHKRVTHAEKTLGAMTSPDGNSAASIQMMQDKAQQLINAVCNGHLHHQNVLFSLKVKFWPRLGYSLCSSTVTLQELGNALHRQYYQIFPLRGVAGTTTVESRTIDAGFYGIGLANLGVEALVALTNKLLMHYGCNMAMGKLMQTLYSLLFVKVGLSFHPLQEPYERYGYHATHSWMKMLWEKLSTFNMKLIVVDTIQQYPQENDQFIMQVLVKFGYSGDMLKRVNCVRILQQLLFMLDILTASGSKINAKAVSWRANGERRLTLCWPKEQLTHSDLQLWKTAVQLICPSKSRAATVGRFAAASHKFWRLA